MLLNGKDYKFKNLKLGELRRFHKEFQALTYLNMSISSLTDEEFEGASKEWKDVCEKIFENPDEGLALENIPRDEVYTIPARFFSLIPEVPTAPNK